MPDCSKWLEDHPVYEKQCELAHRVGEQTFCEFLDGYPATVKRIARNTPFLISFFDRLDARNNGGE